MFSLLPDLNSHLCLLSSPLLIEFWCCINDLSLSAYGWEMCAGKLHAHTHHTCMPLQTKRKWKKYTVGHTVHTWLMEGQFKDMSFFQQQKHILRRAHGIFCLYNTSLRICQAVHNWAEHVFFCFVFKLVLFSGKMATASLEGNGKLEHV